MTLKTGGLRRYIQSFVSIDLKQMHLCCCPRKEPVEECLVNKLPGPIGNLFKVCRIGALPQHPRSKVMTTEYCRDYLWAQCWSHCCGHWSASISTQFHKCTLRRLPVNNVSFFKFSFSTTEVYNVTLPDLGFYFIPKISGFAYADVVVFLMIGLTFIRFLLTPLRWTFLRRWVLVLGLA